MMELGTKRMSSLTKSLQKRIEELRLSIESQKAELLAYERVLEVEVGRENPSDWEVCEGQMSIAGVNGPDSNIGRPYSCFVSFLRRFVSESVVISCRPG